MKKVSTKRHKAEPVATREDLITALQQVATTVKVNLHKQVKEVISLVKPMKHDITDVKEYVKYLEQELLQSRLRIEELEKRIDKLEYKEQLH